MMFQLRPGDLIGTAEVGIGNGIVALGVQLTAGARLDNNFSFFRLNSISLSVKNCLAIH